MSIGTFRQNPRIGGIHTKKVVANAMVFNCAHLPVSLNTIKTLNKNIFNKLGANKRFDTIECA
jgi:hypothetical protein